MLKVYACLRTCIWAFWSSCPKNERSGRRQDELFSDWLVRELPHRMIETWHFTLGFLFSDLCLRTHYHKSMGFCLWSTFSPWFFFFHVCVECALFWQRERGFCSLLLARVRDENSRKILQISPWAGRRALARRTWQWKLCRHLWQKAADRLAGPDYKLPSSRTWS